MNASNIPASTSSTNKLPNFIIYVSDDQGINEMPGNPLLQMPYMQKFINQGMTLNRTYTVQLCAPSRWRMFNGSEEMKDNELDGKIPIPEVTLPKIMHDMGYETAIFGKYGPGDYKSISSAKKMGFDQTLIYPTTVSAHKTFPVTLEKDGVNVQYPNNKKANLKSCLQGKCTFGPDLFNNTAMQFISRKAQEEKPFFLFWTPNIPHVGSYTKRPYPYTSPVPSYGVYKNKPWNAAIKGHAAMLGYVDRDIGDLMKKVDELGIRDNTYVLFVADNGQEPTLLGINAFFKSNYPLRDGKRSAYEGGIRVPAVVWGADVLKNSVSEFPFDVINILPTITDLAGRKVTKPNSFTSFAPIWKKGDKAASEMPKESFALQVCKQNNTQNCQYAFIRQREWPIRMYKLLNNNKGGGDELYEVISDQSETNNLAKNPDFRGILTSMQEEKAKMKP